jgi:hypothetical protein
MKINNLLHHKIKKYNINQGIKKCLTGQTGFSQDYYDKLAHIYIYIYTQNVYILI